MRSIVPDLLAHELGDGTTLAWAMRIVRRDGKSFGYGSSDRIDIIDGQTYDRNSLDISALVFTAGFGVDNAEMTILPDDADMTAQSLLAGAWDGAAFELALYNWDKPAMGRDVRMTGTLGIAQPRGTQFVVELRGLRQALQQVVGRVTMPTCPYRLGDSMCRVDLTPHTFDAAVTSVKSNATFTAAGLADKPDAWFSNAEMMWTSGPKDGLRALVRDHAAGGMMTLAAPALLGINVGDTLRIYSGCSKRRTEDCAGKFGNAVNFGGEPDLPGRDKMIATVA